MGTAALKTMRELNAIVSPQKAIRPRSSLPRRRSELPASALLEFRTSSKRRVWKIPEILRCWARLGNEIKILKVYEKLEEVGV